MKSLPENLQYRLRQNSGCDKIHEPQKILTIYIIFFYWGTLWRPCEGFFRPLWRSKAWFGEMAPPKLNQKWTENSTDSYGLCSAAPCLQKKLPITDYFLELWRPKKILSNMAWFMSPRKNLEKKHNPNEGLALKTIVNCYYRLITFSRSLFLTIFS